MPPGSPSERDRTAKVRQVLPGLLVANLAAVGAEFVSGSATSSLPAQETPSASRWMR